VKAYKRSKQTAAPDDTEHGQGCGEGPQGRGKARDRRTAEARKAAEEYAADQRAIIKKLRKPDTKH
jgi:hypothetical protein